MFEESKPVERKEYTISADLWHRATKGLTTLEIRGGGLTIMEPPTLRQTWEFIAKELNFKRETVQKTDRPNVITAEPL